MYEFPIEVGDKVGYNPETLTRIGLWSGPAHDTRGIVLKLYPEGGNVLAVIKWYPGHAVVADMCEIPLANLKRYLGAKYV